MLYVRAAADLVLLPRLLPRDCRKTLFPDRFLPSSIRIRDIYTATAITVCKVSLLIVDYLNLWRTHAHYARNDIDIYYVVFRGRALLVPSSRYDAVSTIGIWPGQNDGSGRLIVRKYVFTFYNALYVLSIPRLYYDS